MKLIVQGWPDVHKESSAEIVDGKAVFTGHLGEYIEGIKLIDGLTGKRNPTPADGDAWLRAVANIFRSGYRQIRWEDDGQPSPGPWKE